MEREAVGKRIRELRRRSGITGKVFANKTGFSPTAISMFERGVLRPTDALIEKTIEALELSKGDAIALRELGALFNSQFQRWSLSARQIAQNQELIGQREKNSTTIRSYWNQIVPGLLQTEAYMRAVFKSLSSENDKKLDQLVSARLKRQRILDRKSRSFVFVLGEGCLRTCIGSLEVLSDQIEHLGKIINEYPAVELRVLPLSRPLARIPMHHFILYDERTVEIEVNKGQLDLWTDEDVQYHIELMNYLVSVSLPPAKSAEHLAAIKRALK